MQIRFSSAYGLPVRDEDSGQQLGTLSGILIHPDTGKIEGFFVAMSGFFHRDHLFLSVMDIRGWGLYIRIADAEHLSPPDERIRLQPLLSDPRPVLGQKIRTESGIYIGRCRDVQFDTRYFQVEWLFPKKWGRWKVALPISEVVEVKKEAIIVKDNQPLVEEAVAEREVPMMKVPDMA